MSNKQATGGTADPLPNNFTSGSWKRGNSVGPKMSGSAGGNVTGPELKTKKGQQGNG